KSYEKQATFEIDFQLLPTDDTELADIFVNFIENRKKQLGTLHPTMLYIHDIQQFKDHIEEYKFGFSTFNPKNINPFLELSKRPFYIYAKPKGLGGLIPIDNVNDAIVSLQDTFKIAIKDKIYYENAYAQWEKGISKIVCSNGVYFYLDNNTNEEDKINLNININITGKLHERLNDLEFIHSLSIADELLMGDEIIPFSNFHFSKLDEIREMITNLEVLQERFNYFGYDSDINLDLLKPEESQILTFLMEDKPLVKEYNIDGSGLLNIELAGIKLLILVEKNEVDDYYILNNFFERTWKLVLVDADSNKKTTISQFLVLKKEGLLADNIQADRILEDIKEKHANNME